MSTLVYCDANVYLDYILPDRKNRFKDFGHCAMDFFDRTIKCEFEIVVSDWALKETKKHLDSFFNWALFKDLMKSLKEAKKIVQVSTAREDWRQARKRCTKDSHLEDNLHAILAHKAGAKIIVTRDLAGFSDARDLIEARFPEDL